MSNKRIVTKFVLLSLACIVSGLVFAEHVSAAQPKKQRRLILNDDGEVESLKPGQSIEDYLSVRFTDTLNTQVDTYFLCVGATDRGPGHEIDPRIQDTMNRWFPTKKSSPNVDKMTKAYINATHKAGMEIFASIRLNDVHDAWYDKLYYPLKVQRPDLLMGDEARKPYWSYPPDAIMRMYWSALDYGKQEVRDHFRDFVISYCEQYDFDGVELDFCRFWMYFKIGEVEENVDNMTEFLRQIRKGLNEIGKKRGKPYLLTVRVPDSTAIAKKMGLNVEQWLKEGLLDMMMIGGGYMSYSARVKEFIDMAHKYDLPAYLTINNFHDPVKMRSWASNFWALGADGVYVFNWYGQKFYSQTDSPELVAEKLKCLNQLGSPETLSRLDKVYQPDNGITIFTQGMSNVPGILSTFGEDFLVGNHLFMVS